MLVLVTWVAWPPVFYMLYWLANVLLATGRRCSIEGCDPPDGAGGVLWLAAIAAVPAYVTYRWLRWRRFRGDVAA
jgi:hypothetical protein